MNPPAPYSIISIRSTPNSTALTPRPETYAAGHKRRGPDQRARTDDRSIPDVSQRAPNRAMDYFHAAHRGSYYSTPEAASSRASSPENINDRFRFGSMEPGFFPPDQTWDPVDMSSLTSITDFGDQSLRQTSQAPSTDSEQTIVPQSKIRRRAQNRASQRAFRERKERHVKGLETQLELLNEKHQDLLCSYNKQSDTMMKLNRKIEKLTADLKALKTSPPITSSTTPDPQYFGEGAPGRPRERLHVERNAHFSGPEKFDAFSFTSHPSVPSSMPYDGYQLGLDGTIVNTTDVANPGVGGVVASSDNLPDFEDLLQMP
ncbi:hypothetical protein PV04_02964 [Phialophora macrospora]|uniref:Putative transcription factor kapC n=1 Tax=Phialophora macrospora TaxID=1851006 RepID=A0A0D2CZN9_9EURO|nr:hypothetical protein PV04_02964 [Phialophora macrospora]